MMGTRSRGAKWIGVLAIGLSVACSDESTTQPPTSSSSASASVPTLTPTSPPAAAAAEETRSPQELVAAGRAVFNANCIACHNMDPTKDGALGPAVAGSPLPLIEARVLHAAYPAGYSPKRDTRVMVALPHLKSNLTELAAYLDSLE